MTRVKLNSLLAYLLKQNYIYPVDEFRPLIGLWAADVPVVLILSSLYSDSTNVAFGLIAWGLIYLLLILVPTASTYFCASATSQLVVNQSYDLLALTNVSNDTILWSYVIATLYRWRLLLIAVVGFAPIILVMMSVVWTSLQVVHNSDSFCVRGPLGDMICHSIDPELTIRISDQIAREVQVSTAFLGEAAIIAGTIILMAVVGAVIGFVQNVRWKSVVIAGILGLIVSLFVGIVVLPEITLTVVLKPTFSPVLMAFILIMTTLPYTLAYLLVRASSSLVRRPT